MPVSDEQFSKLEDRVSKLEIKSAVDHERHASIVKRLDKIDGHVSKLIWLMITGIVGAFMAFLISGGLSLG